MNDPAWLPRRKYGRLSVPIACRHIVRGIESMPDRSVGFHTTRSPHEELAWCTACDKALAAVGGKWAEAILRRAAFAELCPCCFEFARMSEAPVAIVETARRR